jgi:hypothetical protein
MIRLLALVLVVVAAIDLDVTPEDIDRALAIGRRSDAEAAAFHKPYIFPLEQTVDSVTVRHVEVLTPLRRVVQYAEQRRRIGDYIVNRTEAGEILQPWRTRVAVVTVVRFHPQNVLTSVPPIEALVRDPVLGTDVPALEVTRKALTTPGRPRPILGATIETVFDAGLLASLNATVVVRLHGKELARTTIDFRSIE